jgi:flavin reductase (DIM6/NTAB) family NADH-FMN oxidoreductase RutF
MQDGPGPDERVVTADAFRAQLRVLASPVVVVTAAFDSGPCGATIGSFTSVSLDPPTVSFNLTQGTRLHDALASSDHLAVHLLAANQSEVADRFARPDLAAYAKFSPFAYRTAAHGVPVLEGSLGVLLCQVAHRLPVGDHLVVLATVREIEEGRAGAPLLYHQRAYHTVG